MVRLARKVRRRGKGAKANGGDAKANAGGANPDKAKGNPQAARQRVNKLQAKLVELNDPAAHHAITLGVRDGKTIADTELRVRGEAEKLGPVVPRGYLGVVPVPNAPKIPAGSERSLGTRRVVGQQGQSAHRAGDGESCVASPVRRRHRDQCR